MTRHYSQAELEAFLDESLSVEEMAAIETALRNNGDLLRQLAAINSRRSTGVHSVGEIWRQHRMSCPSREQLGSYLLGVLDDGWADYIAFHLQVVTCRFCSANLEDLQRRQSDTASPASSVRRRKYLQSSVGYLRRERT